MIRRQLTLLNLSAAGGRHERRVLNEGEPQALTRARLSYLLEVLLLVLILQVHKLARQAAHNVQLAELRPEKVHLLRLVLLMEEPPEARFKERADEHLVVAASHVALIVEALLFREVCRGKCVIQLLHLA